MAKTTSFILGELFDNFVSFQVDAGRYASAGEVIREGIRLVEMRDRQMEALEAAIRVGSDSGVAEGFSWDSVKSEGTALARKSWQA